MRHVVVAALVIGCSSKATPTAGDAACVDATAQLGVWLRSLVAEGSTSLLLDGTKLARLDDATRKPIAEAPTVYVDADRVVFQGRLLATVPLEDGGAAIRDALAATPRGPDTLFVVAAKTPWSAVAATAMAAAAANRTHVTFVFEAGAGGKTPRPPRSAVDQQLDELARPADSSQPAPKLYAPDDPARPPSVPDQVFARCPAVHEVFAKIGAAETTAEKDRLVAEGFPKAIATCGCKVEIASVQRLMWSWYRRDSSPDTLGVGVELATDKGTVVTAAPTAPWAEAANAVVAAARAGQPITLR